MHTNISLMTSTSYSMEPEDTTNDDEVETFSNLYRDEIIITLSELLAKIQRIIFK